MGVVVGRLESATVDVEEDDGGQPPEALIAVHERMIAHDGLQERRRLLLKARIDLPPPKRCRRTVRRGVEQSQVPHRPDTEVGGQGQKILDVKVTPSPSEPVQDVGVPGAGPCGGLADPAVVTSPSRRLANGPHCRLLTADTISFGQFNQDALVLASQS